MLVSFLQQTALTNSLGSGDWPGSPAALLGWRRCRSSHSHTRKSTNSPVGHVQSYTGRWAWGYWLAWNKHIPSCFHCLQLHTLQCYQDSSQYILSYEVRGNCESRSSCRLCVHDRSWDKPPFLCGSSVHCRWSWTRKQKWPTQRNAGQLTNTSSLGPIKLT